jgi:hypothetical protein
MALPGEAGEASEINKPSNGLGKSASLICRAFQDIRPNGDSTPLQSRRAGGKVTFEAFRVRVGTELGTPGPGVFVPEVATRVCRRQLFEPAIRISAAPTLTRWASARSWKPPPSVLMRPLPWKAAWLRPIDRPLDPFGEGVRRRAGLSCVTSPFGTPGLRRRRHLGHPASRGLQRELLHKNDCAIGFVCP